MRKARNSTHVVSGYASDEARKRALRVRREGWYSLMSTSPSAMHRRLAAQVLLAVILDLSTVRNDQQNTYRQRVREKKRVIAEDRLALRVAAWDEFDRKRKAKS